MMVQKQARPRISLLIGWLCPVFAVACVGWLAFGLLWRHNPADTGPVSGWLAFAALCGHAFRFHLGILVAVAAIVALLVRARLAAVMLVLLLVPTLGARVIMYAPWRGGSVSPTAIPGADQREPGITVFSANLLFGRGSVGAVLDQIEAHNPDVVLLQEFTPASSEYERELSASYPYSVVLPRDDAFGQAVFSRLPFVSAPAVWRGPEGSVIPMITCAVEIDGRRVAVWNVHTLPPVGSRNTIAQRQMVAWIGDRASELMSSDAGIAGLIVAGDFNATFGSNHLRELRDAGLGEAHDAVGVGSGSTWPRLWWKRHFPGIRLDHVMFSGGLSPVWSMVGDDFGSDHRPVVARFHLD